jgi:hypothetical protein
MVSVIIRIFITGTIMVRAEAGRKASMVVPLEAPRLRN